MMALALAPMRVRNILICRSVAFWASSRMIKALSRVRPRSHRRGHGSIGFTRTGRSDREYNIIFFGRGYHPFLIYRTGAHTFPVRAEYQDIVRMPVYKIIYCFGIVASQYLHEIVLADMTISLQELH